MKLDEREAKRRELCAELLNEAGGVTAGTETTALTQASLEGVDIESLRQEAGAILDLVGAHRHQPARTVVSNPDAVSYDDKLEFVRAKLTKSAHSVLIAARNFDRLPQETVETLYDELIELED